MSRPRKSAAKALPPQEPDLRDELPYSFIAGDVEVPAERRAAIRSAYVEMTEWRCDAGLLQDRIAKTKSAFAGVVRQEFIDGIDTAAKALLLAISNARPHAFCLKCRGGKCSECRTGVVGESVHTDQMRAADMNTRLRATHRQMVQAPLLDEEKAS